jgi:hypothetical protein
MKRHPFALAFSERRMAEPDSNVRRAPHKLNEEVYIRITPKGRAKLAAANIASRIIAEKKALLLARLREADGPDEPVMLQNVCARADVTIEEAMLLIFELNNFCIRFQDAPVDKPFVSLFFNGHSGEVWCELWEPER